MPGQHSITALLIFIVCAIIPPFTHAGCPYHAQNEALKPRSQQHLEPRYYQGSDFANTECNRLSKYAGGGSRSQDWWPCELSLAVLRQNGKESNPMNVGFIYAKEFAKLDCRLACVTTLKES